MKTMETKKTKHISRRLRRFARANEAVSALEYALVVGLVATGIGAAVLAFEGEISDVIAGIATDVSNVETDGTTN